MGQLRKTEDDKLDVTYPKLQKIVVSAFRPAVKKFLGLHCSSVNIEKRVKNSNKQKKYYTSYTFACDYLSSMIELAHARWIKDAKYDSKWNVALAMEHHTQKQYWSAYRPLFEWMSCRRLLST